MSKDKTIVYETCDACKIIAFHQQEKENEGWIHYRTMVKN